MDKTEWGMTPQTVNAGYNPARNDITFPAAILQKPFFNLEADDAINYGAIGGAIGHEMGHAFDDQGRKYDGKGNLNDWWTETDAEAFKARADKLVELYESYFPFEDIHVNGRLTLGENIGDFTAMAIGYKAYLASLNGKEAPVIDGFTGAQRYFLEWAKVWRRKSTEAFTRQLIMTDPHSPGRYRIIGPLSNSPEFMEAFNVKKGDLLYTNPEDRIKIW